MFVYVIKETGTNYYKIGISIHPDIRLKQAQTYNPRKLLLIGSYNVGTRELARKIEYHLHKQMFQLNHVRDEWFELTENHVKILHDWITVYTKPNGNK